jgi:flavin-dependent dehydrogenase
MTQRRRLDAFLLDAARGSGVDVREGVRSTLDPETRTLTIGGERFQSRVVVGADGANGTTAKTLGLGGGIVHGVAYEGNVPYGVVSRERYARRAVVELADIPGGYGWVFAKGDHVNVGVGGWQSEGPRLRDHLARLCAEHGVEPDSLRNVRGHRLPMLRSIGSLARGRVAAIGDAAGLVDPLTGDGMYEAFLSARLAADAALEVLAGRADTLEAYPRRLAEHHARHLTASWTAKLIVDRHPRLIYALTPVVWPIVERMLRGEPEAARTKTRLTLRALAAISR